MTKLFKGTYTAIVTPFNENNQIDWDAFEKIVNQQINGGVEGILFVGTTGESPTLSYNEHYEILRWSVQVVNKRCQIIHGTGSNDTAASIKLAEVAAKAGANGQLVINPYYNKPTQTGLYKHFTAIADATNLPIIMYNIKSRTGVNLETNTLLQLVEHKNIVGVKEASGNIMQMIDVIRKTPDDFSTLVGDDALTLPFMAAGGDGVISVISNCMPKTMSDFIRTCLQFDFRTANQMYFNILDLMKTSFIETNPIPVKEMMALLGYCKPIMRLPLHRAEKTSFIEIEKAVKQIQAMETP